jgi:hypothetical protein
VTLVVWLTEVSEENTASIFRMEESARRETRLPYAGFSIDLLFDPEEGAVCFSAKSVDFYRTTRRHIPEHIAVLNLKTFTVMFMYYDYCLLGCDAV